MANRNLPTKTWVNPRPSSTPEWMRPIIMSLELYLARPQFFNGVQLGDGTPITKNVDGVKVTPPTRAWDVGALEVIESALAAAGTDLATVYATLATMQSDLTALGTDPIAFTRITGTSISTPMLQANSVTATQLAAMSIGVGKWIASTSYTAGSAGWIIAADGTAEFNNVTVRGTLATSSGVTISSSGIDLAPGSSLGTSIHWGTSGGFGVVAAISADVSGNLNMHCASGSGIYLTAVGHGVNVSGILSSDTEVDAPYGVFSTGLSVAGSNVLTTANYAFYAAPAGHTHSSFNGLSVVSSPLFVFHNTTGSAANAVLSSFTGELTRSTSSKRFKTEISDLPDDHDTRVVLELTPKTWKSRLTVDDLGGNDDPAFRYSGLIAEEVAAADPTLAYFDAEGRPESINWPAVTVFLLEEVKRLRADLDGLS